MIPVGQGEDLSVFIFAVEAEAMNPESPTGVRCSMSSAKEHLERIKQAQTTGEIQTDTCSGLRNPGKVPVRKPVTSGPLLGAPSTGQERGIECRNP